MAKKIFALLLAVAMLLSFAACGEDPTQPTKPSTPTTTPSTPTEPTTAPTQPTEPTEPTEPADPWADYACITIAEALALCEQFVEAPSAERYYIRGVVTKIINEQYGQMIIEDATGSIEIYGSYSADGSIRYSAMDSKPVVGDEVLIHGTLQNYKGNTKEIQNGRIIDFISNGQTQEPVELPADGSELTIAELLALPIADGEVTEQFYIVKATVESISNAAYGAMWITDGTGSISVYNSKAEDGTYYSNMADKPYKGDTVTLKCNVKNFKGTLEINQAYILEFQHAELNVDPSEYAEMSIADARATEVGTKVKVTGVVAQITYANGKIPSGVILVDNTSSIYVYDGDLAARCAVGNTISIYASKTYWIQEKEVANAAAFGYIGCNQLEKATLISNDEGNTAFDTSWIATSTVKEILDTPVSTDISTVIFKVTAQIKEAPGAGFTNYYINDLDGKTGSYVYSQCNGGDFEWLRQYDGKIVTVYMMALNAKATASDCFWRFLPIAVLEESFDPSTVNFAENAVKYYGATQFLSFYSGNPALELLTSVSNELLGYTDVALSYVSSDPSIISIDDGVMNCRKTGTAVITVTGEYNGVTYSQDVTIEVEVAQADVEYPTVAEAIAAADGEHVTVQGIVGPSLVNQSGFYLIDDTGIIAVLVDEATMETLEIGQKVVLEADRYIKTKGGDGYFGQSCLQNTIVVSNAYGNHEYCDDFFVTDKTLKEIYELDPTVDYSTTVFVVKAIVNLIDGGRYTSIELIDGNGNKLGLYCSSANQYSFLHAFAGQEVTLEVAACNWNSKNYWRGCVLAVVHEDGTKTLNTLNFN